MIAACSPIAARGQTAFLRDQCRPRPIEAEPDHSIRARLLQGSTMSPFPVTSSGNGWLGSFAARRHCRRRAAARLEVLEARTLLSTYTLPLVNNSLLSPDKYSIYVG